MSSAGNSSAPEHSDDELTPIEENDENEEIKKDNWLTFWCFRSSELSKFCRTFIKLGKLFVAEY